MWSETNKMIRQHTSVPTFMQLQEGILQVCISEAGTYRIENKNEVVNKIVVEVKENVHATIFILLEGELHVEQEVFIKQNAQVNIVYKNDCPNYRSKETFHVYQDASLQTGYFGLEDKESSVHATYLLKETGAHAHVLTTTLAKVHKQMHVTCLHEVAHTTSFIENYGICFSEGFYDVEASGSIVKGAKGSKSHQSTRVLTLGAKEHVKVTPLLLIDENDVEASHACSIGEMNEDHLYYLETRGLNKQQALGLLTLSYVLPILQLVEEGSEIYEWMRQEIENKVGLTC